MAAKSSEQKASVIALHSNVSFRVTIINSDPASDPLTVLILLLQPKHLTLKTLHSVHGINAHPPSHC